MPENNKFKNLTKEQVTKVIAFIGQEYSELVRFVFDSQVCKVSTLLEKFPLKFKDETALLIVLGNLNWMLWVKFKTTIYPIELAPAIKDCAYSLVVIEG